MSEFPNGTQRFTAGGVVGVSGQAKRLYRVEFNAATGTGTYITLYNAADASSTANIFAISPVATAGSAGAWEAHGGLKFPAGCYLAFGNSACQYAVASYNEEVY